MNPAPNICICGGGSVAHVLAAVLGKQFPGSVRVLTRRPADWKEEITINYRDMGVLSGRIQMVSGNPQDVIPGADIVFITVPSFAYPRVWENIQPYLSPQALVGGFPGSGGFEWITRSHPGVVFGMQRIPYVCRTELYGSLVRVNGVRKEIYIGTRPAVAASQVAKLLESMLQVCVHPLPNYLNVSLGAANPIYHSVRNYSLYRLSNNTGKYKEPVRFYEDWDHLASTLFLKCDQEIMDLCTALPFDLSGVQSIRQHYQSHHPYELSSTIRSIGSLKGINAPLIREGSFFCLDYHNRFFTEDMQINLPVYLHIAELAGHKTPVISTLCNWVKAISARHGIPPAYDIAELALKAGIDSSGSMSGFYS